MIDAKLDPRWQIKIRHLIGTMKGVSKNSRQQLFLKLYHGYGHTHDIVLYGHVLNNRPFIRKKFSSSPIANIIQLIKLFLVKPVRGAHVRLTWRNQVVETKTSADGFFKLEWKSETHIAAGWHKAIVEAVRENTEVAATAHGDFFVPHITQYAFISDIDDTVLISHSASIFRRLKTIFTKNPHTRKTFAGVIKHYQLLAGAHTEDNILNPFFYVSSSEWNLYDDLVEFFNYQHLPKGIFLLSGLKKWYELLKTGKTKHEGKGVRIARIMDVFPQQKFVLLGDNSQKDPEIYAAIARRFPKNIYAIFIRNISPANKNNSIALMKDLPGQHIHTCVFNSNEEAIQYSLMIGLV